MSEQSRDNEPVAPDHQLVIAEMKQQLARYEQALQQSNAPQEDDDDFIDLRELFNMLLRRRWTIIITTGVILLATLIATAMMTPIYRASTTVQIERESGKVVEYENVMAEESGSSKDFYETQYELLQSRTLARRVIDQLGLQHSGSLAPDQQEPGVLGSLKQVVGGVFVADDMPDEASIEQQAPDLEKMFLENLTVEPVRNSRLVRLHYDSPSPDEAALVVNTLAQAFVDMSLERRFEASTYAKRFLEDRIKQVRADLEDSERAFVDYTQQRGIISQEDKVGILTEKLRELNRAQVKAESERFRAESQYQEMLTASSDSLSQMLDSEVIQNLKQQKTEVQSERRELSKIFKPAYPKMQQLQEKIDQIDAEIDAEIANIRDGIKLQYQARLREEAKLAESIAATREEILSLQQNTTDFQTLKREVDTNRELYDGLLQRMKEVGVAAGVANNNISVVDAARTPRMPHKPSLVMNLALALVLGLFAGVGLAFLFEMLDDTIKVNADLEKLTDKPVLGVIPLVSDKDIDANTLALYAYHEPTSAFAEAYRSMRTALMFSTSQGAPRVLHFTSVNAGEGKTTTAISTAVNFAQTGANVLLIDGDLRNPSLHKAFNLPNQRGLTNYLAGETEPAEATQATGVKNLFVMSSGPIPPNPAELLTGARMVDLATLAAKRFDYVVIDGPPLLGLADALILADVAQSTLLVAQANSTRLGAIEGGLKRLRQHQRAHLLGSVITKFDLRKSSYGYGYDYQYSYSYGSGPESDSADDEASPARSSA